MKRQQKVGMNQQQREAEANDNSPVKEKLQRYNDLKSRRANWDSHWREVASVVHPNQDDVFGARVSGERKGITVYDNTPVHANELLASALHGMLTNPATYWFGLETGDPVLDADDSVRKWLQDSSIRIHNVLTGSNFQTEIIEVYLSLGSIGTWVMFIEEDEERIVNFNAKPIYFSYISENKRGEVDTVYRTFKWTKRQIMQEFGNKKPNRYGGDDWQKCLKNKKEEDDIEILHCVEPRDNDDYDNNGLPTRFKYESTYLLVEDAKLISESGYREFPYVVPRWSKISGEIYGRSPGMNCLADIKMLQKIMKVQIQGLEKTVNPPLLASNEGVMLPLKLTPGGINYFTPGAAGEKPVSALQSDARVDYGFQALEELRKRIQKAFYIDQLQLQDGPQMTATEVNQRSEQQLRIMGPVLGRLHHELIRPLIDRVFGIMYRKNLLLPPPQALSKKKLQIRYSSLIAKAQRTSEATDITRGFQILAPFFQAMPEAMDKLNADQAVDYIAKIFSWPEQIMNDESDVDKVRSSRQQAQQAQAQAMQQQHQAELIQKAGPTSVDAARLSQESDIAK